ncbi:MAG TPA: hypothetical protein VGJ60_35135, partial [Chloroflexota bacterium]
MAPARAYGRRDFLRQLLTAASAASVTSLLAACGPAAPAPSATTAPASAPAANAPAPATPAAATGAPKRGGTLKVALTSDIIGVDPHGASAGVDRNVYTSVYNGLIA